VTRPATSGAHSGSEKEEPKEPPLSSRKLYVKSEPGGYLRIVGGAFLLESIEYAIKEPYYHYNSLISKYGYYIKPIHKVYKKRSGSKLIYMYYGRYWFRKSEKGRLIYSGTEKPAEIPVEPPPSPLEGVTLIVDNEDLIISESGFDKFIYFVKKIIHELKLSYHL